MSILIPLNSKKYVKLRSNYEIIEFNTSYEQSDVTHPKESDQSLPT